jgi:hypothetical protein
MDGSPAQALYFVIPLSLSAVDEIHGRLSGSAQLLLIAVPLLSFSSYNFVLHPEAGMLWENRLMIPSGCIYSQAHRPSYC